MGGFYKMWLNFGKIYVRVVGDKIMYYTMILFYHGNLALGL